MRLSEERIAKLTLKFNELSSYSDKLDFWIAEGLEFKTLEYCNLSGEVTLSLDPPSVEERILYNQWLIEQWRQHYLDERGVKGYDGPDNVLLVVRTVDELKKDFLERAKSEKREDLIKHELAFIEKKISLLAGANKLLVKQFYQLLQTRQEHELYQLPLKPSVRLIRTRVLGRLWDVLMYKLFLLDESRDFKESKVDYVRFTRLDEQQVELLYSRLVGTFIDANTSILTFQKMLGLVPKDDSVKITWIDRRIDKGKKINRQSLFLFVLSLLAEIPSTGILFKFLMDNFSVQVDEGEKELSYGRLKTQYGEYNATGHKLTGNKLILKKIIEDVLK